MTGYLTDYHTHSICSPDGTVPIREMARAGKAFGLREMCITDHCDLLDLSGRRTLEFDWTDILAQYRQAKAELEDDRFTLRLGLELGGAHVSPAHAAAILRAGEPDFVIGSVHNKSEALGGGDFYFVQYDSPELCHEMLADYFQSLLAVAELGLSDEVFLVGFDSNVATIDGLQEGSVDALIVQNPYAMGYLGVESAYQLLSGQGAGLEPTVDTATQIVNRGNLFSLDSQKALFAFEQQPG